MQLVSALSAPRLGTGGPVEWQEGGANIALTVRGTLADPIYDGAAVITRAKIVSPLLARPLYPVNANVRIQRNTLYADSFDAKCGPRGSVKVRGATPVQHTRRGASGETWEPATSRAPTCRAGFAPKPPAWTCARAPSTAAVWTRTSSSKARS